MRGKVVEKKVEISTIIIIMLIKAVFGVRMLANFDYCIFNNLLAIDLVNNVFNFTLDCYIKILNTVLI